MDLPIVTEDSIQNLQAQVPALSLPLDFLQKTDPLYIMEESTDPVGFAEMGEEFFTVMTEGRVADIMPEGDCLDQVLVEVEKPAHRPPDLGYELHVKDPVGDVVVFDKIENLGLVDVPRVGERMKYAVGINGKILSVTLVDVRILLLSHGIPAEAGPGRKPFLLGLIEGSSHIKELSIVRHGFGFLLPLPGSDFFGPVFYFFLAN